MIAGTIYWCYRKSWVRKKLSAECHIGRDVSIRRPDFRPKFIVGVCPGFTGALDPACLHKGQHSVWAGVFQQKIWESPRCCSFTRWFKGDFLNTAFWFLDSYSRYLYTAIHIFEIFVSIPDFMYKMHATDVHVFVAFLKWSLLRLLWK